MITYGKKQKPVRKGERGTYITSVKGGNENVKTAKTAKTAKTTKTTKTEVVDNE